MYVRKYECIYVYLCVMYLVYVTMLTRFVFNLCNVLYVCILVF